MTQLKAFRIEGTFPMGVNRKQPFAREIICKDETEARENVLSLLGSEHAIKRRTINISAVKELRPEEVTDIKIKHALGVK
jgi:ribosomal protein L20A (L18A)